jgi:hypothetical protein
MSPVYLGSGFEMRVATVGSVVARLAVEQGAQDLGVGLGQLVDEVRQHGRVVGLRVEQAAHSPGNESRRVRDRRVAVGAPVLLAHHGFLLVQPGQGGDDGAVGQGPVWAELVAELARRERRAGAGEDAEDLRLQFAWPAPAGTLTDGAHGTGCYLAPILRHVEYLAERAAHEAAATALGDRRRVAEALGMAALHKSGASRPVGALHVGSRLGQVPRRVVALSGECVYDLQELLRIAIAA